MIDKSIIPQAVKRIRARRCARAELAYFKAFVKAEESAASTPLPTIEAPAPDAWTAWNSVRSPVDGDTRVVVRDEAGFELECLASHAKWHNVAAYRVVA